MKSKRCIPRSFRKSSIIICIITILTILQIHSPIPTVQANLGSIITSKISDWVNGDDADNQSETNTIALSIVDISEMRVRDIKRRLGRSHGYGADEISMMLDKKELINALAFEEHKAEQKEKDRKKRVALRRSIIAALLCVIAVMFKGLFVHAFEVASVNFVVYTDKKKFEFSKCREMRSFKALFGLFLMIIVNMLQLWLSTSVLLSWVMKSKYFFPMPNIPIRPAELLASAAGTGTAGAGPLAAYGLNVGPMIISALFRFLNGYIESFMGKALSQAHKIQRKAKKAARKEEEKKEAEIERQERKAARRARRAERALRKQAAADAAAANKTATPENSSNSNDMPSTAEQKDEASSEMYNESNETIQTQNKNDNEQKSSSTSTTQIHDDNTTSENLGGMDELD